MSGTLLLLAICTIIRLVTSAPHSAREAQSPYTYSSDSIKLKSIKSVPIQAPKNTGALHERSDLDTSPSNETSLLTGRAPLFAAPVRIGAQTFNLVVDTGSADTWVADSFFTCLRYSYHISQSYCALESTYTPSSGGNWVTPSTNYSFLVNYADSSYVGGPLGLADINLTSSISFRQFIGFASTLSWTGGGNMTSGILGLGYSALTNLYHSTDIWSNVPCTADIPGTGAESDNDGTPCNQHKYSSVVDSFKSLDAYKDRQYFALALSRDSSNNSAGGSLTFGGTPDYYDPKVNVSSEFAITPIQPLAWDKTNTTRFYTISIDGFTFPAFSNYSTSTTSSYLHAHTETAGTLTHTRRAATNKDYATSQEDGKSQFIIDSGTEITTIPPVYAKTFNSLFNPPAYQYGGYWYLNCTALSYIPPFGITIAGQTFYHNPEDLVIRKPTMEYDYDLEEYVETETCFSAIQDAGLLGQGYTQNIIGQPTLKNMLAVFDLGNSKMGFAARPYYES